MKTIEQHLRETLPTDICEIAISNAKDKKTKHEPLTNTFERFESALIAAFTWQNTKQGYDYWHDVYMTYPKK